MPDPTTTSPPHLIPPEENTQPAQPEHRPTATVPAVRADVLPATIEEAPAINAVALTPAQKELIRLVNPEATPGELEVFFYQCARTGLDPIAGQIYLVRRQGKMTVQTGIDGYRLVAVRSGMMAGSDDPVFTGRVDEPRCTAGHRPESATVTVWRIAADGNRYPYTSTARWEEYAPDLEEPAGFMWCKLPYLMLGKCAEALALRKAFPAELSGIYTDVEMDQASIGTPTRGGGMQGGNGGRGHTGRARGGTVSDTYHCPDCGSPLIDQRAVRKGKQAKWVCSNKDCHAGKDGRSWACWSDIPPSPGAAGEEGSPSSPPEGWRAKVVAAVLRYTHSDDLTDMIITEVEQNLDINLDEATSLEANQVLADAVRSARQKAGK